MSVDAVSQPLYLLDTNIWLDWLIFDNDTLDELKAAHANGEVDIIYTSAMLEELADVIGRVQFSLSAERQAEILAQMTQVARCVSTLSKPLNAIRCKDKDDQVFVDMALAYRATWLISKDKHLLSLKNRARKQNLNIGTIDDWRQKRR